jgi:hypothetical protein
MARTDTAIPTIVAVLLTPTRFSGDPVTVITLASGIWFE